MTCTTIPASEFVSAEVALSMIEYMTAYYNIRYTEFSEAREAAQDMANEVGHVIVVSQCHSSEGKLLWFNIGTIQDCREFNRYQATFVYPNN